MAEYQFLWKTTGYDDASRRIISNYISVSKDCDFITACEKFNNKCKRHNPNPYDATKQLQLIYSITDNTSTCETIYDHNLGFYDCAESRDYTKNIVPNDRYITPSVAFTMLKLGGYYAVKDTAICLPTFFGIFDLDNIYVGATERIEYNNTIKWKEYNSIIISINHLTDS